jgi:hypothetical protein
MQQIHKLIPVFDAAKFKIRTPKTLFEISPKEIAIAKERRLCFLCGCKLYLMKNRPLYYCRSKRHTPLIISTAKIRRNSSS